MSKPKKLGIFVVTYELLGQQMDLPKGHKVVDVICPNESRRRQALEVVVKGPRLMDTYEGETIAFMNPAVLRDE